MFLNLSVFQNRINNGKQIYSIEFELYEQSPIQYFNGWVHITEDFDTSFSFNRSVRKQLEHLGHDPEKVVKNLQRLFKKEFSLKVITGTITKEDFIDFNEKYFKKRLNFS